MWFPILMQLAAVNDDIPAEADIEMAVCGLKVGRAGGGGEGSGIIS